MKPHCTMMSCLSKSLKTVCILAHVIGIGLPTAAVSQEPAETPLTFARKLVITVANPSDFARGNEPVVIPLADIVRKAPDFTPDAFRVKRPSTAFEPLDIPTQLIAGADPSVKDAVAFTVDLGPSERKTVELWYAPSKSPSTSYPARSQSFESWYHMGTNIAWENEINAYRSYNGVVDFFAKSYPHLRLHDLPPDSYHHESFWGIDPFVIGTKPGLCGVLLFIGGGDPTVCYGESTPYHSYKHTALEGGPVHTGAVVTVMNGDDFLLSERFSLFNGRYENRVTATVAGKYAGNALIAPGLQKFEGLPVERDEKAGYIAFRGSPVGEYGVISLALIWNPADARGLYETDDGCFVKLKPSSGGAVSYLSVALWNRASGEPPASDGMFRSYINRLAQSFREPVRIDIAAPGS